MTASLLAFITRAKDRKTVITAIVLTTLALLIIPELIYAKDIYPNHPRANTMFKLTYQAFIMMGLMLGTAAGQAAGGWQRRIGFRAVAGLVAGVIFVGSLLFPAQAFTSYYGNFDEYKGLNGEVWMKEAMSDYYEAALFLRKNNGGKNMVEAVGDSYSEFNAVSVFSGVPTVLGWRVHEWLWRGGYEVVGQRDEEVKMIYEGERAEKMRVILDKYQVGWILVGPNEKTKYKINEIELLKLGKVVWKSGEAYLIKKNSKR